MKCISPINIRNPKPSALYPSARIDVPCGKCNFCLQNKRKDWSFRLFEEFREALSGHFLTLTYDEEHVPIGYDCYSLCKKDLMQFMKYVNAFQREKDLPVVRYYGTGEYGTITDRPHYHVIAFNMSKLTLEEIQAGRIWGKGRVYVRGVGVESIEYVTKYLIDADFEHNNREKPFNIMSKRPGLGSGYLERKTAFNKPSEKLSECRGYVLFKGKRHKMPRYLKHKIFEPYEVKHMNDAFALEEQQRRQEEIDRLKHFMEDPENYLELCKRRDLERIRVKSLKLNSL